MNGIDLPDFALKYLSPTISGDTEAASSLIASANHEQRGMLAEMMWRQKIPKPAYQEILGGAWVMSHHQVVNYAGLYWRRNIGHMFRYAAFEIPDFIPDQVTIYRGFGGGAAKAAEGISWTTDIDVARFFCAQEQLTWRPYDHQRRD